jgi:hypothetical protein
VLDTLREWEVATLGHARDGIIFACAYLVVVCALAGRGTAQCSIPIPKGPEPFKQLRYDEDYGYLQDENLRAEGSE